MALAISPADLPPRWASLDKDVATANKDRQMSHSSAQESDEYYDSSEEKVTVAPNMAIITRAIREKKSRMHLDERYMSSEEALSLSPPGEELDLTDDGDDTYDVDDLLEDIFEEEEAVIYESPRKRSFLDFAVALSITPMGRAKMIKIESSSSASATEEEDEDTRRMSKASKRDVPFIGVPAIPPRLRPISVIKPIEIHEDGSQSADSPDFWTAVPMFGSTIIPPRSDSIPLVSRTTTASFTTDDQSTSPSTNTSSPTTDASSQFSRADTTATSAPESPVQQQLSTFTLAQTQIQTPAQPQPQAKQSSLFKQLGSKITTLARKPKIDSLHAASNGLAAVTMSSTPAPAGTPLARTNSISTHRRGGSLNLLGARTFSNFSTTTTSSGDGKIQRPKMEARGASERAPMLELPPFPDEDLCDFRLEADDEVRAVSKQLTRRPVGGAQAMREEKESKRRSVLLGGLGRRSEEA